MVMAFYVKLGALLVKQISKPLATQLKSSAVAHPQLRVALTRLGQRMHEYNAALTQKLKTEGEIATGRKVFVTRLDDDAALKKAADFMGEVFIFAVAGAAVAYEVTVSKGKDEAKAEAVRAEKQELRDAFVQVKETLRDTMASVEALDERLRRLEASRGWRAAPSWWPRILGGGSGATDWQPAAPQPAG